MSDRDRLERLIGIAGMLRYTPIRHGKRVFFARVISKAVESWRRSTWPNLRLRAGDSCVRIADRGQKGNVLAASQVCRLDHHRHTVKSMRRGTHRGSASRSARDDPTTLERGPLTADPPRFTSVPFVRTAVPSHSYFFVDNFCNPIDAPIPQREPIR